MRTEALKLLKKFGSLKVSSAAWIIDKIIALEVIAFTNVVAPKRAV